jgi:hypothetical protein
VPDGAQNLGAVEHHLGGDAATVEAGATQERILFDEDGLEAQLSGADGRHVPAGTTSYDGDVTLFLGHLSGGS